MFNAKITKSFSPFHECLSNSGKGSFIAITVVSLLLAVLITASNAAILMVYAKTKRFRSNYVFNFKISICIADLLVGILFIPMVVCFFLWDFISENKTRFGGAIARQEMRDQRRATNLPLISTMGFVNYLPIFISIYSLMFHSIERFLVIRSVHRSIHGMSRFSKWSVAITWIVAIIIARHGPNS